MRRRPLASLNPHEPARLPACLPACLPARLQWVLKMATSPERMAWCEVGYRRPVPPEGKGPDRMRDVMRAFMRWRPWVLPPDTMSAAM